MLGGAFLCRCACASAYFGACLAAAVLLASCGGGGGGGGGSTSSSGGSTSSGSSSGSSTSGSSSTSSSSGGSGAATAPVITQPPAGVTVVAGQSASFSVVATGSGTLSYQWQRAGTPIAGATAATYSTAPVGTLDSGASFAVIVTDTAGSTLSAPARLTVNAPVGGADVLTWHNDLARTGQNLAETTLTPANVVPATFGLLGFLPVDGKVDAQPLYAAQVTVPGVGVKNLLIVATENGSLYAFDADAASSAAPIWHVGLVPTGEVVGNDRYMNNQITPTIGISATPVIDRSQGPNGTIYAVEESMIASTTTYFQRLHAIDLATGADRLTAATIAAAYPGTGDNTNGTMVVFDPGMYKDRAALTVSGGVVYTLWAALGVPAGGFGDQRPYTGWVIGYSEATLQQDHVLDLTPNGTGGAGWMSGAGAAVDATGDLLYMTANGTFDVNLNTQQLPVLGDFGNAVVKLAAGGGSLTVADYFEPTDGPANSPLDIDLGSGGLMLIPDQTDATGKLRQLAVGAGKDGNIYLVDRSNLGKYNASLNLNYQVVSGALVGQTYGTVFASPAWFNGTIYYGASKDVLKGFQLTAAKLPATATQAATTTVFGYPGSTPSISANGSTNPILWAVENNTAGCVLHALDANNLSHELYNNLMDASRDAIPSSDNKYTVPTVTYGKVFVAATSGIAVFGLLP
jgi:hypothetical protein